MHDRAKKADKGDAGSRGHAPEDAQVLGTVPLDHQHARENFHCAKSARVQAFLRGDCDALIAQNYCRVFVWPDKNAPARILGYYSLSACLVLRAELHNRFHRKTPAGIPVPMVLIGFMGRCDSAEKGFGAALILDAARRVSRITDIGIWGIALDAENERLGEWYRDVIGFTAARTKPLFMYAPLAALLRGAE